MNIYNGIMFEPENTDITFDLVTFDQDCVQPVVESAIENSDDYEVELEFELEVEDIITDSLENADPIGLTGPTGATGSSVSSGAPWPSCTGPTGIAGPVDHLPTRTRDNPIITGPTGPSGI